MTETSQLSVLLVLATSAGGVGRHVAELAEGLSEGLAHNVGADVVVAGPQRPVLSDEGWSSSVPFARVDIADRPRPLDDVRAIARLRSLMEARTVVHAHGLRAAALAGVASRLLPRRRRPVVVVTLHNALVSTSNRGIAAVHRVLETIVARTARVVLVVSADIGEAMRARGAKDVLPALVPAPPLAEPTRTPVEVRSALGVPDGAALLVTVARLAPQKGLDTLVDAAALLPQLMDARVLTVIAGEGPLHDALAAQIESTAAPVRLLGRRDDVADLIAAADLMVVPSRWEGQPLVVQEALRAGAALVATDAGGTAGLAGDGAVLVPPGQPRDLAGAITALLMDPAALAALRKRAEARGHDLPTAYDALQQVSQIYRSVTKLG